jgi:hypothetical protein
MGGISPCPIADGTVIGEVTETIKVSGLKLRKLVNVPQSPFEEGCDGCCRYSIVEGEEQTGQLDISVNGWFINCFEYEDGECLTANRTCSATVNIPLSGSQSGAGGWSIDADADLWTRCCDPTKCDDKNIRARLRLSVSGARSGGVDEDCCTQEQGAVGVSGSVFIIYDWDCRHNSRWVGTCPCDLMQEPGTLVALSAGASGCTFELSAPCPCPGTQADDYTSLCITAFPRISGCVETVTGSAPCPPGNNGLPFSITGCN